MPGVGAAVDLHDTGHGILAPSSLAEFVHDFEDDAAFAFVPSGDAGVGDELRGKWSEHVLEKLKGVD